MRLIWTPPEGEKKEYVFKPWDILSPDAEDIELVGGEAWTTYDEFVDLFNKGHRRAIRAALWIARRSAGEGRLRFADLVLRAGRELKLTQDDEELANLRDIVKADMEMAPEIRAALFEMYGGDPSELDADPKAQQSEPPQQLPAMEHGDVDSDG